MDQSALPPAAKLAALIEAGRAANSDLKHGAGTRAARRGGQRYACAMGFAGLGMGIPFDDLQFNERLSNAFPQWLRFCVADENDCGASLEAICLSLREGELAKVTA